MQSIYITTIMKVGTSHGIIIPVNVLRGMKWERGDRLVFGFGGNDQLYVRRLTDKEMQNIKPDITFN